MNKLFLILIVAILLYQLVLPGVAVISLLPQLSPPPISWVTSDPETIALSSTLDLYKPRDQVHANLIIFHAANEQGKDDPRLQKLAAIFARTGLNVYVPTLANLNREKFHPLVLEEIREVVKYAADQNPKLPLKIISFSVGVGPVLIVASEEELRSRIDLLVAFGGYLDLENVVAFHTTGQGQDPFGTWLLARYFAQFLPAPDNQIFYEIADRKWQNLNADISDLKIKLGLDGQGALALLENRDPKKVQNLIEELPSELKNFFAVFDPQLAISNLESEILLLHSIHDIVIPFEESEKLLAELTKLNKKVLFGKLQIFDHVNLTLPSLNAKNLLTIYLPEFWTLYGGVSKVIY